MNITDYLMSKTVHLVKHSEGEFTVGKDEWSCFNSGGVEIEVGEFLYSLTKMIKPDFILETGTHLGISTAYMAQGLEENNKGLVSTCEVIPSLRQQAMQLWSELGLSHRVQSLLKPSLEVQAGVQFDMLFLDSEPQFRFDELLRFLPYLKPAGFILIHDLHPSMGHHGQIYHGTYDWPYGDFRPKLGQLFKTRQLQYLHFMTPRGITMMQKTDPSWEIVKYLDE